MWLPRYTTLFFTCQGLLDTGTGHVREDNLESKHAIGNSLRRRLACVRAEEEKLKLMLQLDEVQLRLKSAEFSKPATRRIRKLNNETG